MADAWSLGITLFIMVTSTMPFDESRLGVLLGNARSRQHYIADLISGHVPKDCQLLIGQLMEPDVVVRLPVSKIADNYWFKDAARKSRSQVMRRSFTTSLSPYEQLQWLPVFAGLIGQGNDTLNCMNVCTTGRIDIHHTVALLCALITANNHLANGHHTCIK